MIHGNEVFRFRFRTTSSSSTLRIYYHIIIMGPKLKNLYSLLERMQYTTLNDKVTAMKRIMTYSSNNLFKGQSPKCPSLVMHHA